MKTHVLIAGAAALALVGGGYTLVISPQRTAIAEAQIELEDTEIANDALSARIPALKAQLETIAPQVDYLRSLSTQVPANIALPDLYSELDAASAVAGIGRAENVAVTVPQLVAPSAPGASVTGDGAEVAAPPADTAGVIASYSVTMSVKGTGNQVVAFLQALGQSPRLNVVSATSVSGSADAETATATITATFYLQQVDVDQIALQIEELSAGTAPAPVDQVEAPEAEETPAPESELPQETATE